MYHAFHHAFKGFYILIKIKFCDIRQLNYASSDVVIDFHIKLK